MLKDTYAQLSELAKNGGTGTAVAGSTLSETEQRRLLREAKTAFGMKRYDQADTRLTELIAQNPAAAVLAEALLMQSKAKYGLGWEQDGVALLERVVDEFPTSPQYPEALWLLGLYYESGGDSFQAVEYFQILADRFQNFKNVDGALYFLAVDDLTNGNGRKAATNLSRVYRNHRNGLYWSHATWMLAYEAYKKKEYAQSERYIQEILQHLPDQSIVDRVLYLQGELALRKEDYQTAFLAFKEVVKVTPDSPLCQHATNNARVAAGKTVNIN
jgi:outer membrane protein assembly factor BamD (BamD/ComL family)